MASKPNVEDVAKGKRRGAGKKTKSMISQWKKKSVRASKSKFQEYDDAAQAYYYQTLKKAKRGDVGVVAVFYYANSPEETYKTLYLPYQYFPPKHAHWAVVQFVGSVESASLRGYMAIQNTLSTWSSKWNPSREKHIRVVEKGAQIGPLEMDRAWVSMDTMSAKHITADIQMGGSGGVGGSGGGVKKKKATKKKAGNVRAKWDVGFQLDLKVDGVWYGCTITMVNHDDGTIRLTHMDADGNGHDEWVSRQSLELAPFGKFSTVIAAATGGGAGGGSGDDDENDDTRRKKTTTTTKTKTKAKAKLKPKPAASTTASTTATTTSPVSAAAAVEVAATYDGVDGGGTLPMPIKSPKACRPPSVASPSPSSTAAGAGVESAAGSTMFLGDSTDDNEDDDGAVPLLEATLDARISDLQASNSELEAEVSGLRVRLAQARRAVLMADKVEQDRVSLASTQTNMVAWDKSLTAWHRKLQRLACVTSIGQGLTQQLTAFMETGHVDLSQIIGLENHPLSPRLRASGKAASGGGSSGAHEDALSVSSGSYASDLISVHSAYSGVPAYGIGASGGGGGGTGGGSGGAGTVDSHHSGEKLGIVDEVAPTVIVIPHTNKSIVDASPIIMPKKTRRQTKSRRRSAELAALDQLDNL